MWTNQTQIVQAVRESVASSIVNQVLKALVLWAGVVVLYTAGSEIAGNEYSGEFAFYAMLSLGFIVVASLVIGSALCMSGPSHHRAVSTSILIRLLPILHAPWLMIAPITIFGGVVALLSRALPVSESIRFEVLMWINFAVVILWIGSNFFAAWYWGKKYNRERERLGLGSSDVVYRQHTLFALLIWFGSFALGAIGGVLGLILVGYLLGDPSLDIAV